ncbi:TadE/TadG family type IV pilus assembly protein [Buchananella felis]|uniref:TadE/TadG family type IV pilus assembly protein n=1 Tax=Buchananella felis TaxID=3231492 RepID=UPI003526EAF8
MTNVSLRGLRVGGSRRREEADREAGNAPAGFALVSGLVVAAILALLQLGFALHVRNLATDAAGEGARRAALFGASEADGVARTTDLLQQSGINGWVTPGVGNYAGRDVVTMTVTTSLPILGPWGPSGSLVVVGRAVKEIGD